MKIQCPECGTSYDIKASVLGTEGRSVKCTRCANRWFVKPEPEEEVEKLDLAAASPAASTQEDEANWAEDADDEKNIGSRIDGADDEGPTATGDAITDIPDDEDDAPAPAAKKPAAKKEEPEGDDEEEVDPNANDIETQAKRPKINVNPNKFKRSKLAPVFNWLLRQNYRRMAGVGIFAGAVWFCAMFFLLRDTLVKQMPDLAGLYELVGMNVNLRGLEFRDLRIFSEVEDGKQVLVVEGSIHNIESHDVSVPAIRLSLRDSSTQEIYAWTVDPRTKTLKGLDETRFRTMLSDPPPDADNIQVRFIDRDMRDPVME